MTEAAEGVFAEYLQVVVGATQQPSLSPHIHFGTRCDHRRLACDGHEHKHRAYGLGELVRLEPRELVAYNRFGR